MIRMEIKTPTIKYPPLCITESEAQAQIINSANPNPFKTHLLAKTIANP